MPSIDVNGAKLSYTESGSGQAVLLLHSSANSSAQWRALRADLETRYRVFALDLYGYGGTDPWSGHRALTLADEAALVGALIERRDGPVHLVGHSDGGAVAPRVALHRPEAGRTGGLRLSDLGRIGFFGTAGGAAPAGRIRTLAARGQSPRNGSRAGRDRTAHRCR